MAISNKDRKILWGRSAGLCAYCRRDLVKDSTTSDRESVVGDECHIISKKPGGPRGGENWPDPLDSYSNLILLCKVHHKLVDDQPNTFTSTRLRSLKRAHEEWVSLTRGKQIEKENEKSQPIYAWRLQTGGDIASLLSGAEAYQFNNSEPSNKKEVEIIGVFLQMVFELGEVWDDIEPGRRVEMQYSLSKELHKIEEAGFVVFGTSIDKPIDSLNESIPLRTVVIQVIRSDDSQIVDLSASAGFEDKNRK